MRKLASYLLTLLFIIAYGHCMAEQLGALHNSDARCCAPACQTSDHCSADDGHHHDQENNGTPDEPTPCQLCFILKTDSVLLQDGVKVPAPVIIELPDYTPVTITQLERLCAANFFGVARKLEPDRPDRPDSSDEFLAQLSRTSCAISPIRGSSAA